MATNLSIENLQNMLEIAPGAGVSSTASNARVAREMEAQGMQAGGAAETGQGKSFGDLLKQSFDEVNQAQHQADDAIKELVAGRSKNIHETMLTIEKADTSLKIAMQVRNKILDAYKEIIRMQV